MFKTVHEAVYYIRELRPSVADVTHADIVIAPPFTAIYAAADAARNSNIAVASQDVHWEQQGAFTGEVSAGLLVEA
ncbi:MAG: triose-phosphate isomerase, partial [Solimonas sp.]